MGEHEPPPPPPGMMRVPGWLYWLAMLPQSLYLVGMTLCVAIICVVLWVQADRHAWTWLFLVTGMLGSGYVGGLVAALFARAVTRRG